MNTKCPLGIKNPNHSKKDGSCLCFDHPAVAQDRTNEKIVYRWSKHIRTAGRKHSRKLKEETT